ncbi:hypothetical protein [Frigoriflavimonas asaccharolytica]|uniref:Uncharacterized protein n=1 Tax=Frigoriflavimonas asaccharolytica TaxID=2735899 RepID=A0A8J8G8C5_9FLAO|nr:hypothetical protein [Frigoriflavimonas asaccharolytica]NRS93176.1 hypothetical protein [Frigoriflavimonas asaccharolytica]
MNKILTILALAFISSLNGQVVIGGATGSAGTNNTSVLLDFATGQNKGIIVPYVRNLPTGAALVPGSIILDARTATAARMRYYNGTTWVDLSGQDAVLTTALTSQPTIALAPETTNSKAIIGATSSSADGVLVLESTTKAMILPMVTDVQNIPSPSPGMMVYVNKAGAKRLAVYNGARWSFWKP